MPKRLNREQFIERAKKVHKDKYDYSLVDYKNSKRKIKIICPIHGVFEQQPNGHLTGRGCSLCSKRKNYTTEEFISISKSVHGDRYDYRLSQYNNGQSMVEIICPNHGVFKQKAYAHMQGHGCEACGGTKRHSIQSFIKASKEKHGNKYDYSKVDYKTATLPVIVTCPQHGDFKTIPSTHMSGYGHCPMCSTPRNLGNGGFIRKAKKIYGDTYDYSLVNYTGAHDHVTVICPKHGEFMTTPDNHYLGNGCTKCSKWKGKSKYEEEIIDFIKSIYNGEVIANNRTLISPKELDIVIPDKKLAIEFDGIYWHSTYVNEDTRYHLRKTEDCLSKGYQLIHIYEDEWDSKSNVLKSLLAHKLGCSEDSRVYARKCHVGFVGNEEAKNFLDCNHIQGYTGSSIKLGLYHNDDLVAYMGLMKLKDNTFNLNRYATSCSVPGGFSKLLSHFKRSYEWKAIITYADRRHSNGDLYHKTGFELVHKSAPSFDYVLGSMRLNRQQFMKHKLKDKLEVFDPSLTEKENMRLNGYAQLWNCGYLKFRLLNK